jgi:hypothetical protein
MTSSLTSNRVGQNMRIKSGSTYREGYRDGVSCAQWLQLVSGFVYLLIAHPKAPLWPVGSECTFPGALYHVTA